MQIQTLDQFQEELIDNEYSGDSKKPQKDVLIIMKHIVYQKEFQELLSFMSKYILIDCFWTNRKVYDVQSPSILFQKFSEKGLCDVAKKILYACNFKRQIFNQFGIRVSNFIISKIFFNLSDDLDALDKFMNPPDIQLFMLWTKDQDQFVDQFFDDLHQGSELILAKARQLFQIKGVRTWSDMQIQYFLMQRQFYLRQYKSEM
ncbi:UNKNOWN [Stylonychia lemnae]|uniref:Uncharacterized protein n=1 Tax=Stylonychia lemnae TaxID=5949 RepID=A0A078AHZ3_STYLE|nr:UNKNOWN [Stylonychia lemnae]|eukprot:CDW81132.1 UNKNOWN [Stylonychia lemnae]